MTENSETKKLRNDYVASCVVLNPANQKILFVHHKKLGKWLPPGGHIDHGELPQEAAVREVLEETGLAVRIIPQPYSEKKEITSVPQIPLPFCILHENIPASKSDEEHMHVDFIYIAIPSEEKSELSMSESEVHDAGWFSFDEIENLDTFDNVKELLVSIKKQLGHHDFLGSDK